MTQSNQLKDKINIFKSSDLKEILLVANLPRSGNKASLRKTLLDYLQSEALPNSQVIDAINNKYKQLLNPRQRGNNQYNNVEHSLQINAVNSPAGTLVELPFYEILETIHPFEAFPINWRSNIADINLKRRLVYDTRNYPYSVRVLLRFGLLSCEDRSRIPDDIPFNLRLSINGSDVSDCLPGLKPSRPHEDPRRPGVPIDITPFLSSHGNATLFFSCSKSKDRKSEEYAFTVQLTRLLTIEELTQKIVSSQTIPPEVTKTMIKDYLNDDNEVSVDTVGVSLKCPVSLKRITTPVRTKNCGHIQVFDLVSYLRANYAKPSWLCPLCPKLSCLGSEVYVDRYLEQIIRDVQYDEVLFDKHASYHAIERNAEGIASDSDSDDAGSTKRLTISHHAPTAGTVDIVDLCSSDDEEEIQPKKTLPPVTTNAGPSPTIPQTERRPPMANNAGPNPNILQTEFQQPITTNAGIDPTMLQTKCQQPITTNAGIDPTMLQTKCQQPMTTNAGFNVFNPALLQDTKFLQSRSLNQFIQECYNTNSTPGTLVRPPLPTSIPSQPMTAISSGMPAMGMTESSASISTSVRPAPPPLVSIAQTGSDSDNPIVLIDDDSEDDEDAGELIYEDLKQPPKFLSPSNKIEKIVSPEKPSEVNTSKAHAQSTVPRQVSPKRTAPGSVRVVLPMGMPNDRLGNAAPSEPCSPDKVPHPGRPAEKPLNVPNSNKEIIAVGCDRRKQGIDPLSLQNHQTETKSTNAGSNHLVDKTKETSRSDVVSDRPATGRVEAVRDRRRENIRPSSHRRQHDATSSSLNSEKQRDKRSDLSRSSSHESSRSASSVSRSSERSSANQRDTSTRNRPPENVPNKRRENVPFDARRLLKSKPTSSSKPSSESSSARDRPSHGSTESSKSPSKRGIASGQKLSRDDIPALKRLKSSVEGIATSDKQPSTAVSTPTPKSVPLTSRLAEKATRSSQRPPTQDSVKSVVVRTDATSERREATASGDRRVQPSIYRSQSDSGRLQSPGRRVEATQRLSRGDSPLSPSKSNRSNPTFEVVRIPDKPLETGRSDGKQPIESTPAAERVRNSDKNNRSGGKRSLLNAPPVVSIRNSDKPLQIGRSELEIAKTHNIANISKDIPDREGFEREILQVARESCGDQAATIDQHLSKLLQDGRQNARNVVHSSNTRQTVQQPAEQPRSTTTTLVQSSALASEAFRKRFQAISEAVSTTSGDVMSRISASVSTTRCGPKLPLFTSGNDSCSVSQNTASHSHNQGVVVAIPEQRNVSVSHSMPMTSCELRTTQSSSCKVSRQAYAVSNATPQQRPKQSCDLRTTQSSSSQVSRQANAVSNATPQQRPKQSCDLRTTQSSSSQVSRQANAVSNATPQQRPPQFSNHSALPSPPTAEPLDLSLKGRGTAAAKKSASASDRMETDTPPLTTLRQNNHHNTDTSAVMSSSSHTQQQQIHPHQQQHHQQQHQQNLYHQQQQQYLRQQRQPGYIPAEVIWMQNAHMQLQQQQYQAANVPFLNQPMHPNQGMPQNQGMPFSSQTRPQYPPYNNGTFHMENRQYHPHPHDRSSFR